jgi:hypothetical protein
LGLAEHHQRLTALEKRIAELEQKPSMQDTGPWQPNKNYQVGDVCSFKGGAWVCHTLHNSGNEGPMGSFRLFVRAGRDARGR